MLKTGSPRALLVSLSIACLCALSGCTADGTLYPVQGPLAKQSPLPAFHAKITGGVRIDHFYVTLEKGETASCAFQSSSAAGGKVRMSDPQTNPGPDPVNMATAWDAIYGATFYDAHVLGTHNPYYWCAMTGSQGTALRVELYLSDAPAGDRPILKGVVQDDKGNLYKFVL